MSDNQTASPMFCAACGHAKSPNAMFCEKCGTQANSSAAVAAREPEAFDSDSNKLSNRSGLKLTWSGKWWIFVSAAGFIVIGGAAVIVKSSGKLDIAGFQSRPNQVEPMPKKASVASELAASEQTSFEALKNCVLPSHTTAPIGKAFEAKFCDKSFTDCKWLWNEDQGVRILTFYGHLKPEKYKDSLARREQICSNDPRSKALKKLGCLIAREVALNEVQCDGPQIAALPPEDERCPTNQRDPNILQNEAEEFSSVHFEFTFYANTDSPSISDFDLRPWDNIGSESGLRSLKDILDYIYK